VDGRVASLGQVIKPGFSFQIGHGVSTAELGIGSAFQFQDVDGVMDTKVADGQK
jgi:hypothetical protein